MRKIKFLLFCFLFVFIPSLVFADVNYTFESGTFHVVYINSNGSATSCDNSSIMNYDSTNIELVQSFNTYDEALGHLNTLSDVENKSLSIIGERKDKVGNYSKSILYSKYALVDLNTTGTTLTTSNVYTSATNNSNYTYINGHGMFGGVDSAFIDYNNGTTRANIKIAGVNGWINSLLYLGASTYTGYDITPLSVVKSPSYYYVDDNGSLIHRLSKKITANNCYSTSIYLGPAPSSLVAKDTSGNMIRYYSYDGIYFYTDTNAMLDDYKKGSAEKSVNIIPYYNYYMYMPIRTKTNITKENINDYLVSRNYTSKDASMLYGEEATFIDAQNKYGVNAITSFATAINESGWGTSALARNKNNLFGHNAVDSDVMSAASGYKTVADGVYRHAYYMINAGFSETKDAVARYYGSHLGNKNSGINVKYASDPYWGEKIASHYYSIDNYSDLKDYHSYTIGIKTSNIDVEAKKEPDSASTTLYKLESYYQSVTNMPVVVLERVAGESIDGNNIWYKIQSDALLDSNRENIIQDTTIDNLYDWNNNYVYVHSSYITLMDENVKNIYTRRNGIFGLEELQLVDKKINIKGYLAIEGINNDKNSTVTYDVVFQDETTNKTYELPLNRITDMSDIRFVVTNDDNYDYTYSWFNGTLDLSEIPEGNYTLYIRARSKEYESKEILSNVLLKDIVSKFTDDKGRGYQFRTNYYLKTIPIELFIRDDGLISDKNTPTIDNMFNQYRNIELKDGNLNISGTSFNIGGDYSTSKEISRKIIFENIETFERFEYDLGYIDTREYEITLVVPDNLSKTRAWFNNSINISELEKGTYAIYIKTVSNIEDYDELTDIFGRSIDTTMSINDKNYSFKINDNQRFRIELYVK